VAIEIVAFQPSLLPAVVRFAERTWHQHQGDGFYTWRFLDCPAEMLLAVRGAECLAILCAFKRKYRAGGVERTYAETFDWYSLPELRHSGLGVLLLREMMNRPEPMLVVGGSADTMTMLPRMGWRDLPGAELFVLPRRGAAVSNQVRDAYGIPKALTEALFDVSAALWFRTRQRQPPQGYAVRAIDAVGEDVLSLYRGESAYGLTPVPDLDRLRWLTSGTPAPGRFVATYFTIDGALSGWTLAKVSRQDSGWEASLLECYTQHPDVETYSWMVAATARRLSAFGPAKILARATCPVLRAALRHNRFLSRGFVPVRFWSRAPELPAGPVHLTYNVGDADMVPYADRG